ncbi:MAG: hypothetical protein AAFR79_15850 [Pseudomonadota bacterium]
MALSGFAFGIGEAQRLKPSKELLAKAAGHRLYMLDEPTTGLDFEGVRTLLNARRMTARVVEVRAVWSRRLRPRSELLGVVSSLLRVLANGDGGSAPRFARIA